jgi:hypothetical protein
VYLAARWSRREEIEKYAAQLAVMDIRVTSRWLTDPDHRLADQPDSQAFNSKLAMHDLEDVTTAEALIYFAPGGTRGGSHVEFGMALAQKKRLFWVGEREHVFSWLRNVELFPDWSHLLAYLQGAVDGYVAKPPTIVDACEATARS